MNDEKMIIRIREICNSPQPEHKREFFQYLKEQKMLNQRLPVMSHGEFLAGQLLYIGKWIWIFSGLLLLFITWICYRHPGNYPFALTPFLALGICGQIFLKKCHACEAVPGRHCKYSRTSYHHFDHPAIFFLFPDSGIPVHDGTLSDCFVVRVGL